MMQVIIIIIIMNNNYMTDTVIMGIDTVVMGFHKQQNTIQFNISLYK